MTGFESLSRDLPTVPDAQATVTDFLDYTEYLPSDLVRSLRLIGNLDEIYQTSVDQVHRHSKVYRKLPTLSSSTRPNSQFLRQEISYNLDHAIHARESSYAEASRLCDQVDRHCSRLSSIITKLHALPKPPSRDPTPVARVRSPQINRVKTRADGTLAPRITLRLGGSRAGTSASRINGSVAKPRYRSRKVTVPGEVLPPPNPDSPPPVTDSEWEVGPISPIRVATSRVGVPSSSRNRPAKPARRSQNTPKIRKLPKGARPPRLPGQVGTNVHSAVAGISTSNALSLLDPPPPNAKPGSCHAPWMRLTEWEMATLRKRMKKNAIWSPSETMIRRELAYSGRGPENYRAAKARADDGGEDFLDDDDIANSAPRKPLGPGEISTDALSLSNKGMKLNEAKKVKREIVAREQAALAAAEAELAAKRLADVGSTMKNLFNKPIDGGLLSPMATSSHINGKPTAKEKAKERDKDKEKERAREKEKAKELERQRQKVTEIKRKRQEEREAEEKRKEEEGEKQAEEERRREEEARLELEKEQERERQEQLRIEEEKKKALEEEQRMEHARLEETEKEKQRQQSIEATKTATLRKRKRDPSPMPESPEPKVDDAAPNAPPKRVKTSESQSISPKLTTKTMTTTVPLAAPAPPGTPMREPPTPTATSTRTRRQSLTLKGPAPPPPPISMEAVRSTRGSTGPPSARPTRERHPRKSATPAATPTSVPPTPVMTAASRRSKRPAPGPVTNAEEDAPAVSTGKRKNAPKKKGTTSATSATRRAADGNAKAKEQEAKWEEEAAGEDIDPNEPRYCICGDVSWGDMICCENNEVCPKEHDQRSVIKGAKLT